MTRLSSLANAAVPPCPRFDEFVSDSLLQTRRDVFEHKQRPKSFNFLTPEVWGNEWPNNV